MGTFLGNYNSPKLNQEKTENMKNPINTNDIISIVKYLHKENLSPMVSLVNSIKCSRINSYNLYKLFQGTEKEGTLPNLFIVLVLTRTTTTKKPKMQASFTHELTCKNKKIN